MFKGVKLRIYPNLEQQSRILWNFGSTRFVWNAMLDMQMQRYENNHDAPFINGFGMNNLLKQLKVEYPWLKEAESTALQDTCETLAKTYQRFFKKISGYPKFKSRKYPKQSYTSKMVGKNIDVLNEHYLKLPKLGILQYKGHAVAGKIKNATIKLSPTGKFYCVLLIECGEPTHLDKTDKTIGLDFGIADLIVTSDSDKYSTIRFDKLLSRKKLIWEKRLARRRALAIRDIAEDIRRKVNSPRELRDFKNYMKAKQMVAKYNEKVRNQRVDYLHKISTELVKNYDLIVIEDLKTKNMIKNHNLARSIANQSWRSLREMLEYKCAWYGKQLVIVNPYKTSQVCSACGYDDGKHTLDVRDWTCPGCGTHHDRDINAAKNIRNLGLGQALVNRETSIN